MSRIAGRLQRARTEGRAALVPYLMAGDPEPAATVSLLHALAEGGADMIELGVPFSDPMADGPVIQAACERALAQGTTLRRVLDMVAEFRREDTDTPLILMGYCNPVLAMGVEDFARGCASAGVDGVLLVDRADHEDGVDPLGLDAALERHELDPIFLIAPTTTDERIRSIAPRARGFLYYISLRGTTGAPLANLEEACRGIERIRAHTDLPIGIGFGIRDADTAARAARFADAVIVGSALVETLRDAPGPTDAARTFVQALRAGTARAA